MSVHEAPWPQPYPHTVSDQNLEVALGLMPDVARCLEELRARAEIGSSFDARIILLTKDTNRYTFLASLQDDLCEVFKVSQVVIDRETSAGAASVRYPDIAVKAEKADGSKCARCWNFYSSVGSFSEHPTLCATCVKALGGSLP